MRSAVKASVRGRVQGVGFRPFVFQIAHIYGIYGTVQNNMDGVKIHIEGEAKKIYSFLEDLKYKTPRLAKIDVIQIEETEPLGYKSFDIIASERSGASMLVLPIDSAVCEDCLEEMFDPKDLRHQYPFINCTQCGPRYTIISDLPYDRPYTSMNSFPMCEECEKEYQNPLDRRHHAQPIACPKCGPSIRLIGLQKSIHSNDPLATTIQLIKSGKIVAIKGLGGYHLCCDALNDNAVKELRARKNRPNRPLAVMAKNVQTACEFAQINQFEEKILLSPEAPIVVIEKKNNTLIGKQVAPGMNTIGIMLPYTPLHHLLFSTGELECLVMTSANRSGQPILYKDEEAIQHLAGIADYILLHNREILHPIDDSVVQVSANHIDFLRRARGYVPDPIHFEHNVNGIIAFGGQQKTTFTIGRNEQIFIGPHIGDLENLETMSHYKNELKHLLNWIQIPFQTAVVDMHPSYNSRILASEFSFSEVIEVQHHHAHLAACKAENRISGPVWGVILDGTGYGLDGNIWGFEFLYGDEVTFDRMAHLKYTPLPGGEKAIKEPWKNAVAMLIHLLGEEGEIISNEIFNEKKNEISVISSMVERRINSPLAGTCGRLFDAVSAICGICKESTYDGEAAIKLSELADESIQNEELYQYEITDYEGILQIDFSRMISQIAKDVKGNKELKIISTAFHETLVQAIVSMMKKLKENNKETSKNVVLSGGSFHNRYLHNRLSKELSGLGLKVYSHQKVPCNDGGISFGQLVVAAAKRRTESCV